MVYLIDFFLGTFFKISSQFFLFEQNSQIWELFLKFSLNFCEKKKKKVKTIIKKQKKLYD